jgi:hypothetical protein
LFVSFTLSELAKVLSQEKAFNAFANGFAILGIDLSHWASAFYPGDTVILDRFRKSLITVVLKRYNSTHFECHYA